VLISDKHFYYQDKWIFLISLLQAWSLWDLIHSLEIPWDCLHIWLVLVLQKGTVCILHVFIWTHCHNVCEFVQVYIGSKCYAYTKSLWRWYLRSCLWEFYHIIYRLSAVGNREKLIRFRGQKVKGEGYSETTYGQISTLGGIFPPISWMRGHILMKLFAVTHYQARVTTMTSLSSWIKG